MPRKGKMEARSLGPRDAHGVEGLNIQDVEATAPVHQHLGQALVANYGVNDEQEAPRSGGAGRVVTPVEVDRYAGPTEKLGDGIPNEAEFPESDLLLTLGAVVLWISEDHEVVVRVGEAAPFLGWRSLIFGGLLLAVPALAHARLTQHALEKLPVLELVLDGVAVIATWLLQELLEVVGVALSLARTVGRHDRVGVGTMSIILLPFPLP
jgi:hypothetical protein